MRLQLRSLHRQSAFPAHQKANGGCRGRRGFSDDKWIAESFWQRPLPILDAIVAHALGLAHVAAFSSFVLCRAAGDARNYHFSPRRIAENLLGVFFSPVCDRFVFPYRLGGKKQNRGAKKQPRMM